MNKTQKSRVEKPPLEVMFKRLHNAWVISHRNYWELPPELRVNLPEPGNEPILYKGKVCL